MAIIDDLRRKFHQQICSKVIFLKDGNKPSMADVSNRLSLKISEDLLNALPYPVGQESIAGQSAGKELEEITKVFLEDIFSVLNHIRPGKWIFSVHTHISDFDQYRHLAELVDIIKSNQTLITTLGDYIISPDVIVARQPLSDEEINQDNILVSEGELPKFTPLRSKNNIFPLLHASISCKWTLRSDRSQNARAEGLNLIRHRKGNTPHIAILTGEPLPSRISSLALGTGDIDCVYHFALPELILAVNHSQDEGAIDLLDMMISGRRLRDIADLPFDLCV